MKNKIILFSTGCPQCRVLIQKLNSAGIEYNLETDMSEILEIGMTSVPVLKIDDEYLTFKEANNWINAQVK